MQNIAITSTQENNFQSVWELYQASFPLFEQRDLAQQRDAFSRDNYHLLAYYDANELVGFVSYWSFESYRYIEHFAISQKVRGRGYGSAILNSFLAKTNQRVILEIDPLTDEVSTKRWEFYQKCYLFKNDFKHVHPPYKKDQSAHALVVLSSKGPLSEAQYAVFAHDLIHSVMTSIQAPENKEQQPTATTTQQAGSSAELQPVLQNQDLALYPLTEQDFEGLFQVASDPLIWEQHPNKDRYKREVFRVYFEGALASKGAFKVVDKATGNIIGCTRYYDYNQAQSSVLIGFTFYSRQVWGKGVNPRVKKLMMDHIFGYVDTILFHVGAENIRSQKAIERLGAVKVKTYEGPAIDNQPQLKFVFALAKKDYVNKQ